MNTPSHARINGYLSISATSTYTGQIGFNRDVNTGAIFNSSNAAYQINGYQTYLLLEGYNSSGTNTFIHRFYNSGNLGLDGRLFIGTGNAEVSGTQVAIVRENTSTNLMRWGTSTTGTDSYRIRIDQNFDLIGNNGDRDWET